MKRCLVPLLLALAYLAAALFVVGDYGMTVDEPGNFGIGHKYLHFYATGELDFADDSPRIKDHPHFADAYSVAFPHRFWPLANILSAASCRLFFRELRVLGPVAAHHAAIPFLVALLVVALFVFVRKYRGGFTAFLSVAFLLTYPVFFGHALSNIKDVPLVVFFSLTVLSWVEAALSRRLRFLYAGFFFWGCTFATKMDALYLPAILLFWLLPEWIAALPSGRRPSPRLLLHGAAGTVLAGLIAVAFYPPLLPWFYESTAGFFAGSTAFAGKIARYTVEIGSSPGGSFNAYAPLFAFVVTPPLALLAFLAGAAVAFRRTFRAGKSDLELLLLIWVFFPIARHCLPNANHYDGIRHFMVYVVPFAVLAALGVASAARFLAARLSRVPAVALRNALAALFLVPGLWAVVRYHPYQTAYFTELIGGLRGAQALHVPYSWDYWLNSYGAGARWLDEHAAPGSFYTGTYFPHTIDSQVRRPDLSPVPDGPDAPPPGRTYLFVPFKPAKVYRDRNPFVVVPALLRSRVAGESESEFASLPRVFRVGTNGAELLSVYEITEETARRIRSRIAEGEIAFRRGDLTRAEAALAEADRLYPLMPGVVNLLGVVHVRRGDRDGARALFERAQYLNWHCIEATENLRLLGQNGAAASFRAATLLP